MQAQKEAKEGPNKESRARVGFEVARRIAKGEVVAGVGNIGVGGAGGSSAGGRGPNGESLKNEWDRKRGGVGSKDRVMIEFGRRSCQSSVIGDSHC